MVDVRNDLLKLKLRNNYKMKLTLGTGKFYCRMLKKFTLNLQLQHLLRQTQLQRSNTAQSTYMLTANVNFYKPLRDFCFLLPASTGSRGNGFMSMLTSTSRFL